MTSNSDDYLLCFHHRTLVRLDSLQVIEDESGELRIDFEWWTRGRHSKYQVKKALRRFVLNATWLKIYQEKVWTLKIRRHLDRNRDWSTKFTNVLLSSDPLAQQLKSNEERGELERKLRKIRKTDLIFQKSQNASFSPSTHRL